MILRTQTEVQKLKEKAAKQKKKMASSDFFCYPFVPCSRHDEYKKDKNFPGILSKKQIRTIYMDKDIDKNQMYCNKFGLSFDRNEIKNFGNVLVIGDIHDSIKHYVKPNLLNTYTNKIIFDPDGSLYESYQNYLKKEGYTVLTTNTFRYNPLAYLYDKENDSIGGGYVGSFINTFTKTANPQTSMDPFRKDVAYGTLLTALVYYVLENDEIPKNGKSLETIYSLLERYFVFDSDGKLINRFTEVYERFTKASYGLKETYETFTIGPESEQNKAVSSLINDLKELVAFPEARSLAKKEISLDFEIFNHEKVCLFVTLPENVLIRNCFMTQMYQQLFDIGMLHPKDSPARLLYPIDIYYIEPMSMDTTDLITVLAASHKFGVYNHVLYDHYDSLKETYDKGPVPTILNLFGTYILMCGDKVTEDDLRMTEFLSGKSVIIPRSKAWIPFGDLSCEVLATDFLSCLGDDKCVIIAYDLPRITADKYDITRHPKYKKFIGTAIPSLP